MITLLPFKKRSNVYTSNFISNNVKEIPSSVKRLKSFEYLKKNIHHNDFVFLQETHSFTQDKKKWKNDFKDPFFLLMVVQILVE